MKKLIILAWLATLTIGSSIAAANGGQVGAGRDFACAIHSNGTVWCAGDNTRGQLGFEPYAHTHNSSTVPVQVVGISGSVVELSVGDEHACVVTTNYRIYCWGDNSSGQLGLGDTSNRYSAMLLAAPIADHVSAGGKHTCAIQDGVNTLYCWGANDHGQLGLGDTVQRNAPVLSVPTARWSVISAGGNHTCAILSAGTNWDGGGPGPYCWGWNGWGQMGNGNCGWAGVTGTCGGTDVSDVYSPAMVSNLTAAQAASVSDVAAYAAHTCMIMGSVVYCSGKNDNWQCNNAVYQSCAWIGGRFVCAPFSHQWEGIMQPSSLTIGLQSVLAQGSSSNTTCSLKTDGSMRCWGDNVNGQLGYGSTTHDVNGNGPHSPTGFTSGVMQSPPQCSFQNCAASAFIPTHQYMWGLNNNYQMGTGDGIPHYTPITLPGT